MIASLLPLLLAAAQAQAPAPLPRQVSLVSLDLAQNGLVIEDLQRLDFDIAQESGNVQTAQILADELELARLEAQGWSFSVLQPDLSEFYRQRAANDRVLRGPSSLGAFLNPPFGSGSMGSYYTFAELLSVLDQITAAYPTLTTDRFSIGTSIEGRNLWAVKVSNNPDIDENEPEVRFDALHHAREPQSMHTTLWAMLSLLENYGSDPLATYLVDNREIWFIPAVNPDGYVYNQSTNPGGGGLWRKNRRNNGNGSFGIDLNRNYDYEWGFDDVGSSPNTSSETYRGPSPASEPEVAAMQAFIDNRSFDTVLTAHSFSNLWLFPVGYVAANPLNLAEYDEVSELATEINNYQVGPAGILLYLANGVTDDYDHFVHGSLCWTPEIGSSADGFWPTPSRIIPLAMENELAFRRTALAAGAYVHLESLNLADAGDGDGHFEPGESFELTLDLRNSGREASGQISLDVQSSDPFLTPVASNVVLGSLGSFSSQDNAANPLSLAISVAAPNGATLNYELLITYEGYTQTLPQSLQVGEERLFLTDDLELDTGWIAGLPGDTAATGLWAYGDPVGTVSNGEDSNPEDDATPGAGVNCFATGNGSTSAGGDDVDSGLTTLITPPMDLSGLSNANISYQRWYALFSTIDDSFQVSISDDDGQNWVSLENLTSSENQWNKASFSVGDFVSLSDKVRLRFIAEDDPNNSLVEAGVDEIEVSTFDSSPLINVYGQPQVGSQVAFHMAGTPGTSFVLYASPNTADIDIGVVNGPLLISPTGLMTLSMGSIPASGLARNVVSLANDPANIGKTLYLQALQIGGGLTLSNRVSVTLE